MSAGDSRRRPARFGTAIARISGRALALGLRLTLALILTLGCASSWVQEAGRFSHSETGLSISSPVGGPWTLVKLEGTTLTLRDPAGSTLSWLRTCRDQPASARLEARALLRGIEDVVFVGEGAVAGEAGEGWRVDARITEGGLERVVRVVTRVAGNCTDDWILVAAPGADAELAGAFDGWWGSVRAPQVAADAEPGTAGGARP